MTRQEPLDQHTRGERLTQIAARDRPTAAAAERPAATARTALRAQLPDRAIDRLDGVIETSEEAIVNTLLAGETMTARDGMTADALRTAA